jgi:hypothetical protein
MNCEWFDIEDILHNLHHIVVRQVDEDNAKSAACHLIGMAPEGGPQRQVMVAFLGYISPGHGYEEFEKEIKILLNKYFGDNHAGEYNRKPH